MVGVERKGVGVREIKFAGKLQGIDRVDMGAVRYSGKINGHDVDVYFFSPNCRELIEQFILEHRLLSFTIEVNHENT